jgi:hypothetical protein
MIDSKKFIPSEPLTPQNWPFPVVNGELLRKPVNPFEHEALL